MEEVTNALTAMEDLDALLVVCRTLERKPAIVEGVANFLGGALTMDQILAHAAAVQQQQTAATAEAVSVYAKGKGAHGKGKGVDSYSKGADGFGKGADGWGKGADGWGKGADGYGKGADGCGKGDGKDPNAPRHVGTIKSFNPNNGYGFIHCPETHAAFGMDVFLHNLQLGDFKPGDQISFSLQVNAKGKPQAYNLEPAAIAPQPQTELRLVGPGVTVTLASPKANKAPPKVSINPALAQQGPPRVSHAPAIPEGAPRLSILPAKAKAPQLVKPRPPDERKRAIAAEWDLQENYKRPATGLDEECEQLGQFMGTIKSFNDQSGYGFISCSDLQNQGYNDAFLPARNKGDFNVGDSVIFTAFLNQRGQVQSKDLQSADALQVESVASTDLASQVVAPTDLASQVVDDLANEAKQLGIEWGRWK